MAPRSAEPLDWLRARGVAYGESSAPRKRGPSACRIQFRERRRVVDSAIYNTRAVEVFGQESVVYPAVDDYERLLDYFE